MEDYILWDIKKRDWVRYDMSADTSVRKVIMVYSRCMAEAYVEMYLDRGKRKYIAIAKSLSDEAKDVVINDYYNSLLSVKVEEEGVMDPEGDGVEYDLFGNVVEKR